MERIARYVIMLVVLSLATAARAQDIQITKFERNYTSLIASMNPVYDNAGEVCAVIRFFMRGSDFLIEPNLGVLKTETLPGEIRMWVPKGTKRITVRHPGMMPLTGYEIPVKIVSKVTYEATIEVTERSKPRQQKGHQRDKNYHLYVGAGFNAISITGPSATVGFSIKQHQIEAGFVYGLNKSDEFYFYGTDADVIAAYHYQAYRVSLRYGYEFKATDFLSVVPQIGVAYNTLNGKSVSGINSRSAYSVANSLSALGAVRLVYGLNEHFKLQVTPEYDFGIAKDNNCKILNDYKTIKSWTVGFSLNVGMMVSF